MFEIRESKSSFFVCFEVYGVRLKVSCFSEGLMREIDDNLEFIFPVGLSGSKGTRIERKISVRTSKNFRYVLFEGRKKLTYSNDKNPFINYFFGYLRRIVAEFAKSFVFLHAGVVGWKGKALILPGRSFGGKTTLVRELTKLGAKYYSDEYAVLDEAGLVHPFPKTLSVRGIVDDYQQVELPVEEFGGEKGVEPLAVGMILLTEYEQGAVWAPRYVNGGFGVLELLSHTIPIRYDPKFSLKVLNKTANRAIIVKSKRGEASDFALKLLSFFEKKAL
ncbi:MAG: hypothetical protein JSS81_08950 [Acidobacteria bacterium]|nr:hypothetical protein [Acidobacteriota bacterium]